jgi:hypothetical protein
MTQIDIGAASETGTRTQPAIEAGDRTGLEVASNIARCFGGPDPQIAPAVLSRPLRGPISPYYYAVCPTPCKNALEPAEVKTRKPRADRARNPRIIRHSPVRRRFRAAVNAGDIVALQVDPDQAGCWA